MIKPSWHKILADLIGNPLRSLLVIASIFVGLFAIGVITTTYLVMAGDMRLNYGASNPANIMISTALYDRDLLDHLRHIDGVREVDGERALDLRVKISAGTWKPIHLRAMPDGEDKQVNRLRLLDGSWPPGDREIVLEQHHLNEIGAGVGDWIPIELSANKTRTLKLVGIVQDQSIGIGNPGGFFNSPQQGYVTQKTVELLEQSRPYLLNSIYVTVAQGADDLVQIEAVKNQVRAKIDATNVDIYSAEVRGSSQHPNQDLIQAVMGILILLGVMVVFLSGFLITSTLQALLNQQMVQVGIMKTVGANRFQIVRIYQTLILIFGLLAFVFAAPLANYLSLKLVHFLALQTNIVLQDRQIVLPTVFLQFFLAIFVPQVAAFFPVWQGAQLSVVQALNGLLQNASTSQGWAEMFIASLQRISRPMRLALRNAFRRKDRLILTLLTLTLGGAVFIATFNVRISLQNYVGLISNYFQADVNISTRRPYRIEQVQSVLAGVPGIQHVEGWAGARGEVLMADGTAADRVQLLAPPAGSILVEPILMKGRWIIPGDQNAIVLNDLFLTNYPDLNVGDTLHLRINGDDTEWMIVGFFQLSGKMGGYMAYANYEYFSELIHQPFQASMFRVVAEHPLSLPEQERLADIVGAHLKANNIMTTDISTGAHISQNTSQGFNTLTAFLMFMAILIALVGSIGLAGTMSMNIMERTREIGIMRSIGATNQVLMQMVILEGMVIGLLSWFLGAVISFPVSKVLADGINLALFGSTSQLGFTLNGFVLWLLMVVILSATASILPARNASRLTIREVLNYE